MTSLSTLMDTLRRVDPERALGLHAAVPPLAVEITQERIVLVRLGKKRRQGPALESHRVLELPPGAVGGSIFRPNLSAPAQVVTWLAELFEKSGTRPGRLSLVLPDNLAKISLLSLPERPAGRRQLDELVRFRLRRSIPFRMEEARLAYQELPGDGGGVSILVAVMRHSVVEQYEQVLEAMGARPGRVVLCTPSILPLCAAAMERSSQAGGDVALLNCTPTYFSLLILRAGRLIFYRCKSYPATAAAGEPPAKTLLSREVVSSVSYYQEKLGGQGIGTLFVRDVSSAGEEVTRILDALGLERAEMVDAASVLSLPEGLRLDAEVGQRIAPAVGAAAGRGA